MRDATPQPPAFRDGERVKPLGLTHARRHGKPATVGIFVWPGHTATVYACDDRHVTLIFDGLPHARWVAEPSKFTA